MSDAAQKDRRIQLFGIIFGGVVAIIVAIIGMNPFKPHTDEDEYEFEILTTFHQLSYDGTYFHFAEGGLRRYLNWTSAWECARVSARINGSPEVVTVRLWPGEHFKNGRNLDSRLWRGRFDGRHQAGDWTPGDKVTIVNKTPLDVEECRVS